MKDGSIVDFVVKDLFQRDHPEPVLDQLTAGVADAGRYLNVELARVKER